MFGIIQSFALIMFPIPHTQKDNYQQSCLEDRENESQRNEIVCPCSSRNGEHQFPVGGIPKPELLTSHINPALKFVQDNNMVIV